MNLQTHQAYTVIKSDHQRLDEMFKGLFVVARAFIGCSSDDSSYPFVMSVDYQGNANFTAHQASFRAVDAVELNEISEVSSKLNKTIFVTLGTVPDTSKSGFMFNVLNDIKRNLGLNGVDWLRFRDAVNGNKVAQALFDDYFELMLAYARSPDGEKYSSDWITAVSPVIVSGVEDETPEGLLACGCAITQCEC